jgi:nucleotide-binding universal stress UspA family protein
MSLKAILVHIDDSERCTARLDVAIRLALDSRARLIGVYLVPTAVLAPSVAALLPADFVEQHLQALGEAQHSAESGFRDAARKAGLTHIEWRAPAGSPVAAAVEHGRCGDLFVMGQQDPDDPALLFAQELITSTLLAAGRPLLIVPYIGAAPKIGRNVLVAWDGGREAARAIADALPLLAQADKVCIAAADSDDDQRLDTTALRSQLLGWLHDHQIEARVEPLGNSEGDVASVLLSRAADLGSDLIVMGGYGHARMRELILGGATRAMLDTMTVPVLMSH